MEEKNTVNVLIGNVNDQVKLAKRLTTLNYLLNTNISTEELNVFVQEHPYKNVYEVFDTIKETEKIKLCLFTFSNPMELENVKPRLLKDYDMEIISSDEIFNLGLERRSLYIKNYKSKSNTLIIQFLYLDHLDIISQLKSNIEQNQKITKVLFIIHLEREYKKREILKNNIGVNYWNGWDNRVLDNLNKTDYVEYCKLKDLTFEELILTSDYQIGVNLLKEACLLCIMKVTHEKQDVSLRANMFNIRKMIEDDPENTFINIFRDKLKNSNLFKGDSRSWIEIINERNRAKDDYVDFENDLLSFFKENFSDKLKKYFIKINTDLKNIASYSLGFNSEHKPVVEIFVQHLKENLEACTLNDMSVRMAQYTDIYYRLPFLQQYYKSIDQLVHMKILDTNKDVLNNLFGLVYSLKIATKTTKEEETRAATSITKLRENIKNAENFISSLIEKLIAPSIEELIKSIETIKDFEEVIEWIENDIFSICTRHIKNIKTEEHFKMFKSL